MANVRDSRGEHAKVHIHQSSYDSAPPCHVQRLDTEFRLVITLTEHL